MWFFPVFLLEDVFKDFVVEACDHIASKLDRLVAAIGLL